ncbi:DEAD-box family helicase [Theileria orientalis]|uniref:DEAD-box family helicase n=1 Tax=Theileria orientalis TaxID=68886 RepID=A0A976MDW1_THEOR|nr:DEAD-box family helicase [Theileria orientalis]
MDNYYGNVSDFWTSDEEALEDESESDKNEGTTDLKHRSTENKLKNNYASDNIESALESLDWIPSISLPLNGRSLFDIFNKDFGNLSNVELEQIKDEFFASIYYSNDAESDEPEAYTQAPLADGVDADYSQEKSENDKTTPTNNAKYKYTDFLKQGPVDNSERKPYKLIIPKPGENKNYIRKKWSIVDDKEPPVLEDLIIEYPFVLDDFQKKAIHHLINGKHVFVSAHTSAGKTVVAEYAIALALSRGEKAIYTSPIKALSNQKYREFKDKFGPENVGIVTGDVLCNPTASCLIVTTEILRNLLYRGDSVIEQIFVVIFDEIHYINDLSRGVVWEEVIIMLPKEIQLVMLSATVPNYVEFAEWIGSIMQKEVIIILTNYRSVPLKHYLYAHDRFFLLVGSGGFNKEAYHIMHKYVSTLKIADKKATFKGEVQKLQKLLKKLETEDKLPVVLFCFNRQKCEQYAKDMPNLNLAYTKTQRSKIHLFLKESLEGLTDEDRNLPQLKKMIKLLARGIGVHHSGLLPIIKEMVEILFSRGLIKVLFATETFAMGVNMPARSVVFTSIYKHDGIKYRYLTSSEYTQMAGRAGRRGLDTFGNVYIFCSDEAPDVQDLTNMIIERSTRLESRFRITYNMLLQIQSRDHMNITEMMLKSFREREKMMKIPLLKKRINKKKHELENLPPINCIYGEPTIEGYYKALKYSKNLSSELHQHLWNHRDSKQIFKYGRVLMLHSTNITQTLSYSFIKEIVDQKNHTFKVVTIITEYLSDHNDPNINLVQHNDECIFYYVHEVGLSSVSFIFENVLLDTDLNRNVVEMNKLIENNKLTLMSFSKKFKQISMQFYETLLKQRDLYHAFSRNPCTKCLLREQHFKTQENVDNYELEIEDINKQLKDESLYFYDDMINKLEVLKQLEFLDEKGRPTIKGRIATFITTSDELTLTEVLAQNILAGLSPPECAAILSAFIYNDKVPEKEAPSPTLSLQQAKSQVINIHKKIDVVQRAVGVRVSQEYHNSLCNFTLSYLIYQWASGVPFNEIMELTDLQDGHIVRVILRLDELCRKMVQTAGAFGDATLAEKIDDVCKAIRRDIVFKQSLYLR